VFQAGLSNMMQDIPAMPSDQVAFTPAGKALS